MSENVQQEEISEDAELAQWEINPCQQLHVHQGKKPRPESII